MFQDPRPPDGALDRTPDTQPRLTLTTLLGATTVGVYLLVVVGASTTLLDGSAACSTWPACPAVGVGTLDDPALTVAWAHRVATLIVGMVVLATAVAVRRRRASRRVGAAVAVATALFPVQIVLGALTATRGGPLALSAAHLTVGMGILSATMLALLWHLEGTTDASGTGDGNEAGAGDSSTALELDGMSARNETGPAATESGPATIEPSRGDVPGIEPGDTGRLARVSARVGAYLSMTKPKLMWLLCLVALAAMGLAGGRTLDSTTVLATLAGGVLAIGASGTFNNVLERDVDRKMARTADRPLVTETIPTRNAVAFGLALAVTSVTTFLAFTNALAAALGLTAILFYSVVYTVVLKPNTTQNIVIGGAVGAFPALIGWAAVTNAVEVPALALGAVIFLWTPAHFYNLALVYREDYARAGFPMLPVVRGEAVTRRHIFGYLGATFAGSALLGAVTRLDLVYAVAVTAVGAGFVWAVVRLFEERTEAAAVRSFHASNAYLGTLLLAVVIDSILV